MTFEEYLLSKKIDSQAFAYAQPLVWQEWRNEFAEMHANSFTAQKLYLINKIRRQFPLKEVVVSPPSSVEGKPANVAVKPKPVIRPKIN